MAAAYAPIFLVGAPFGWPPVSFLNAVPWPVINQFLCIVGGCLWAAAAVIYQRNQLTQALDLMGVAVPARM